MQEMVKDFNCNAINKKKKVIDYFFGPVSAERYSQDDTLIPR